MTEIDIVEEKTIPMHKLKVYVESESNLGMYYKVTYDNQNYFKCTCPHFKYRGKYCKHIEKVQLRE